MPQQRWNSTAKAFLTLGIAALYIVARNIPLPTVIPGEGISRDTPIGANIMALGFEPLISGFVLVELAALIVPMWRHFRTGNMTGRARLHRASIIVGMFLAFGQAIVMVLGFKARGATVTSDVVTVIILVGATAALVVLTWFVNRDGLGSGFTTFLLAAAILGTTIPIGNALTAVQSGPIPFSALLTEMLGLAVLVLMALFLFSRHCLPETAPHALMLSRPACGITPLTVVPQVLLTATFLARLIQSDRTLTYQQLATPPVLLIMCIIAAFVFAFLFNSPDRVALVWNALSPNPPEGIPRMKAVMLESVLFIALAVIVQEWLIHRLAREYVPQAATVIMATAVACDLAREWRARKSNVDLTSIWEIHQPYAVVPAMRLLETQGLHPFARGLHLRSLLQFFGPYVPIQILVPADEAQTAQTLLQSRWPSS